MAFDSEYGAILSKHQKAQKRVISVLTDVGVRHKNDNVYHLFWEVIKSFSIKARGINKNIIVQNLTDVNPDRP